MRKRSVKFRKLIGMVSANNLPCFFNLSRELVMQIQTTDELQIGRKM